MTTADAAVASSAQAPWGRWLGRASVAALVVAPMLILGKLQSDPTIDVHLHDDAQHFTITTNIALVAAVVALLVARIALEIRHYGTLLVALGFMSLAGIFVVHGLATPTVLMVGELKEFGAGLIVATSAQLSLLVPGLIFAVRQTPLVAALERSPVTPRWLVAITAVVLLAYGVVSLTWPAEIGQMYATAVGVTDVAVYDAKGSYADYAPWVSGVALAVIAIYGFNALRQAQSYLRSRLPTQGALAVSFVLLGEAQVAMLVGDTWSLSWWGYHTLMGVATLLAIGALFVELDRRRGLERFLPPNVVERVIVGDRLSLEGQRRTATILFTDLRGSTALAEHATPEAAVATVNAYLRVMARAVIDEGGILDKFTGDGLMAIFGAMADPATGAQAAAGASVRMRTDLAALNADRSARGEPTVGYGVGIHTGEVVLGAVGLPERSDYTAMGDTVNTAARMEQLTKELGTEVVLSAATGSLLDSAVATRPLGTVQVKGRTEPVEVFALA